MLNLIAQALFMARVVGQVTVGNSPVTAVLLAAIGIVLIRLRVARRVS
jgi:hypothetical protein